MMFIKTYKDDLINVESIAYLTWDYVRLEPQNVYDELGVYRIVATMRDFTKIIVTHFADKTDMFEALDLIVEQIPTSKVFQLDLWNNSGSVIDCVHLIGDMEDSL